MCQANILPCVQNQPGSEHQLSKAQRLLSHLPGRLSADFRGVILKKKDGPGKLNQIHLNQRHLFLAKPKRPPMVSNCWTEGKLGAREPASGQAHTHKPASQPATVTRPAVCFKAGCSNTGLPKNRIEWHTCGFAIWNKGDQANQKQTASKLSHSFRGACNSRS